MYAMVCHTLAKLPALQALGLRAPLSLEAEDLDRCARWLVNVGVPDAQVQNSWRNHWEAPVVEALKAAASDTFASIASLMAECTSGKFAGVDMALVSKLLNVFPPQSFLQRFLSEYFKVVQKYTKLLTLGAVATSSHAEDLIAASRRVLDMWPSCGAGEAGAASGQDVGASSQTAFGQVIEISRKNPQWPPGPQTCTEV